MLDYGFDTSTPNEGHTTNNKVISVLSVAIDIVRSGSSDDNEGYINVIS